MSKFKVGQLWRTRGGDEVVVNKIVDCNNYPVKSKFESYTLDGTVLFSHESTGDLVELVPSEDSHEALTFAPLDDTVGDINSTAKGSGARYNGGKAPLELIPLALIAEFYIAQVDEPTPEMLALQALGAFQARGSEGRAHLIEALHHLGANGWAECAQVFDYGRGKYAAWNWAKGMAWSVPIACAARHLLAKIRGEDVDPESGKPHRGHSYCNIVMLLTYEATFPEGDDRPAKGLL